MTASPIGSAPQGRSAGPPEGRGRAGVPCTVVPGATSWSTTDPAPDAGPGPHPHAGRHQRAHAEERARLHRDAPGEPTARAQRDVVAEGDVVGDAAPHVDLGPGAHAHVGGELGTGRHHHAGPERHVASEGGRRVDEGRRQVETEATGPFHQVSPHRRVAHGHHDQGLGPGHVVERPHDLDAASPEPLERLADHQAVVGEAEDPPHRLTGPLDRCRVDGLDHVEHLATVAPGADDDQLSNHPSSPADRPGQDRTNGGWRSRPARRGTFAKDMRG